MSFSSVDNKKQYLTDGIVDTFSFPYPFQQTSDLVVQLKDNTTLLVTTLVENTDYTVTTVGDAGRYTSGSVVTDSTYAAGSTITILRIVANDQETANYNPGGEFDEQSTEDAFDLSSMQAQQIYNLAVILKKSGDVAGPLELPDLADNAGKLLQINDAGTGFTASDSTTSSDARVNSLFNGAAADDIFTTFINLVNGALIIDGTGTPEGSIVAPVGSIFLRTDGGADTSIYFKETGAGNTGWVARDTFASLVADALSTDTISEKTAAAGVTVDGVLLKDSEVTTDTINEKTAANGVVVDSCTIKDGGVGAVTDQGVGTILKTKSLNIGAWNMDTTAAVNVAHGLTFYKIHHVFASIANDDNSLVADLTRLENTTGAAADSAQGVSWDATNIVLARRTGDFFDAATYNLVSQNIIIAPAVDKGSGLVGIPLTSHGMGVGAVVTISGTTNYNGTFDIVSKTANEFVITATYVAETFAGTETVTLHRGRVLITYEA
jgi:hypothetical protein